MRSAKLGPLLPAALSPRRAVAAFLAGAVTPSISLTVRVERSALLMDALHPVGGKGIGPAIKGASKVVGRKGRRDIDRQIGRQRDGRNRRLNRVALAGLKADAKLLGNVEELGGQPPELELGEALAELIAYVAARERQKRRRGK